MKRYELNGFREIEDGEDWMLESSGGRWVRIEDAQVHAAEEYNRGFAVGSGEEGAYQREIAQLRECLAEALGNYARLRTGVLDIADCRPMSATTRRRLRELVGAPPQGAVHNEKS